VLDDPRIPLTALCLLFGAHDRLVMAAIVLGAITVINLGFFLILCLPGRGGG
jgi:hypothetical protein